MTKRRRWPLWAVAAAGAIAAVESAAGFSAGLLQAATANMAKALTKERRLMRYFLSAKEESVRDTAIAGALRDSRRPREMSFPMPHWSARPRPG